jgi:membrane protein involved in colicin uptake
VFLFLFIIIRSNKVNCGLSKGGTGGGVCGMCVVIDGQRLKKKNNKNQKTKTKTKKKNRRHKSTQ